MNDLLKNCSAGILAGGENRRMPVPKAFIRINGRPIIERNLQVMKQLFGEVFVITNKPEDYIHLGVKLIGDIYDLRCPMTGIFTALTNANSQWVFISACDMPFINSELIRFMSSKRKNFEAVVPLFKGKIEPLFAFYSKVLIRTMEKTLFMNKKRLQDFLKGSKVKIINTGEIQKIDAACSSFININTLDDLKHALKPI